MKLYIVHSSWNCESGSGNSIIGVFTKMSDAEKSFQEAIQEERMNSASEDMIEELTEEKDGWGNIKCLERYRDGEYSADNIIIKITEKEIL